MSALLEAEPVPWDGSPEPLACRRWLDGRDRRGVALTFACPDCTALVVLWLRNPLDGGSAPDGILDGVLVPFALFTRVGDSRERPTVAEPFEIACHPGTVRITDGRIHRA